MNRILKTLTVGEQEFPIRFGIREVNEFAQRTGIGFLKATNPAAYTMIDGVVKATVIGLNAGAKIEGTKEKFDEDRVCDMIDTYPEIYQTLQQFLMEAIKPLGGNVPNASTPQIAENQ